VELGPRLMLVLAARLRLIPPISLIHRRTSRCLLVAVLLERRALKGKAHHKGKGKVVPRARVSTAGTGLGRVLVVRGREVLASEEVHRVATTSKAALILDIPKVAVTPHSMPISRGNSSTGNDFGVSFFRIILL
jgi:hypothetical protein